MDVPECAGLSLLYGVDEDDVVVILGRTPL